MTTYKQSDPTSIQSLFNSIAKRYDRSNSLLSLGMHKNWNRALVKELIRQDKPHQHLDLCCGTGDIAFEYLKRCNVACQSTLIDFCSEMLACAKEKGASLFPNNNSIQYIEADALQLPLENELVDCATIAYGIRNVQFPLKCMQEVYRVLKPGGTFGILELTRPQNAFMKFGHKIYMRTILPVVGKWIATNKEAYLYLMRTIETFISPTELMSLMEKAKFTNVKRISLMGGIATIIVGEKR